MTFQDVRSESDKLWFRLDAKRCLIEIQTRLRAEIIDLTKYGLKYVGNVGLPEHEDTEGPDGLSIRETSWIQDGH